MIFIKNQKTPIFKKNLSFCYLETVTLLMYILSLFYACSTSLFTLQNWNPYYAYWFELWFFSLSSVYAHIFMSINIDVIQYIFIVLHCIDIHSLFKWPVIFRPLGCSWFSIINSTTVTKLKFCEILELFHQDTFLVSSIRK